MDKCGPALLAYPDGLTVFMAGVGGLPFASWRLNMARWNHSREGVAWGHWWRGAIGSPVGDRLLWKLYSSLSPTQDRSNQTGIETSGPA